MFSSVEIDDNMLKIKNDDGSYTITTSPYSMYDSIESKINYDYDDIFNEIVKRLSKKPLIKHQCHSCGAILKLEQEKHIFVCKYCGSCYAIGTEMINSL